VQPKGVEPLTF